MRGGGGRHAWLFLVASTALALAGPALSQTLGHGGGTDVPLWRVFGALALCLALAVGAAFALKARFGGGPPLFTSAPRRLQLIESLRLSHQIDICLLRLDDREIIVAATPHGATLLAPDFPPAEKTQ